MDEIFKLSRRDFLKTGTVVGGGLVLGFYKKAREIVAKGWR